jgi:hypothetical protein
VCVCVCVDVCVDVCVCVHARARVMACASFRMRPLARRLTRAWRTHWRHAGAGAAGDRPLVHRAAGPPRARAGRGHAAVPRAGVARQHAPAAALPAVPARRVSHPVRQPQRLHLRLCRHSPPCCVLRTSTPVHTTHAATATGTTTATSGGPGFEAPRPTEASGWIKSAVANFRVVLMDQRGTGCSSAVTANKLAALGSPEAQARYLSFFRRVTCAGLWVGAWLPGWVGAWVQPPLPAVQVHARATGRAQQAEPAGV